VILTNVIALNVIRRRRVGLYNSVGKRLRVFSRWTRTGSSNNYHHLR